MKRFSLFIAFFLLGMMSFAQSLETLKSLADEGDPEAQFSMFNNYLKGYQVWPDSIQAVKYLEMAAENDHPEALYMLGNCYLYGRLGYPTWAEKAEELLFRSNELGYKGSRQGLSQLTANRKKQTKQVRKEVYKQIMSVAPQSKTTEYVNKKSSFISDKVQQSPNQPSEIIENGKLLGSLRLYGSGFAMDDQKLSNELVKAILTPEDYRRYLVAKRDLNVSATLGVICITAEVVFLSSLLYWGITKEPTTGLAITSGVICVGTIPIGFHYDTKGRKVMAELVEKYNSPNRLFSFHVSPTMMSWKTPQVEGNYGMGLTFSVDF